MLSKKTPFKSHTTHSHFLSIDSLTKMDLFQVVAAEEANKMSPMNLAIVFGPNLIWGSNEIATLASLGEINLFTYLLIVHFSEFFTK